MSGGSYDYLCTKTAEELFNNHRYQLRNMADDLSRDFAQSKAARDTTHLLNLIESYAQDIENRSNRLEHVWHHQEWWKSNDYSRDQVERQIASYETDTDNGGTAPLSTDDKQELQELRRKKRELESTIETLKAATIFFARECNLLHH